MARLALVVALLVLLVACTVSSAEARKSSRRLNSGYPKSGSSPSGVSPPYSSSSPSSGSSPSSTPSSTPVVTVPPVTSTPSPVTIPPVTSSPTGGYGGYGSHTGTGTPKYWGGNPGRVPKILSLLSSLAKIFGPRVLKFLGGRTMLGAIKDSSPDAMSSLAREGSASLINAYAYNDFPLTTGEVVSQFNDALSAPGLAAQQATKFQQYNEAV